MPGGTYTINQYRAVAWGSGGDQHLIAWSIRPAFDVAGISLSPDVTYPVAGPYPTIEVQNDGILTIPSAPFTAQAAVYLDQTGALTQGPDYGQAAIHSTFRTKVGFAFSTTQMVLVLREPVYRSSANVRPLVISDTDPRIHQATDAEMTALGLTP